MVPVRKSTFLVKFKTQVSETFKSERLFLRRKSGERFLGKDLDIN